MKRNNRFTLLEVMIVVCVLALSAGVLLWKAQKWVEREKFISDVSRFKSFLIGARMRALNTRADWTLEIVEGKKKTLAILSCRENRAINPQTVTLGDLAVEPTKQFVFYSSGKFEPDGFISIGKKGVGAEEVDLSELFRIDTNDATEPPHPRILKK